MPSNITSSSRPNYATLQEQVFASFTARADFMPATLTYWYFSTDDALTRTTIKPARFAAHPVTKLAHTAERCEDLPLMLPYTQKGAPGISVCRAEWDAAGVLRLTTTKQSHTKKSYASQDVLFSSVKSSGVIKYISIFSVTFTRTTQTSNKAIACKRLTYS